MIPSPAKIFTLIGGICILSGVFLLLWDYFNLLFPLGKLPGDITIRTRRFAFLFPLTSMVFTSLFLSGISWFAGLFRKYFMASYTT